MKIKKYLLYFLIFIVTGAIAVSIFFAVRDRGDEEIVNEDTSTAEEEPAGSSSRGEDGKATEDMTEEEVQEEPVVFEDHYTSRSEGFTNYTFRCPEGWTISEENAGETVMVYNTGATPSGNGISGSEYIMVKVEDMESGGIDPDSLTDEYLDTAVTGQVEKIDFLGTDIGDRQGDIEGYYYESGLTGAGSADDSQAESSEIDLMTYTVEGDHVYILKYMSSGIEKDSAIQTFSGFLKEFMIGSEIEGTMNADESKKMNILILGVDSGMGRDWGRNSARSDINMILHINLETYGATIVTIPRDLWVPIPGHGEGKINGAHAIGGPELAVQTFEDFSSLDIDNYIITDFDGFMPLIDFLGGVTIEVYEDLADGFSNCYLDKGVHHLNGEQTLALCRNRHRSGDGSTQGGAWAREREAAKVIKALYEQKTTLQKILALPAFADLLLRYTWTDLDFMDIMRLLPILGRIGDPEIELRGVPSYSKMIGNASAVVHYEDETAQMFEEIKNQ